MLANLDDKMTLAEVAQKVGIHLSTSGRWVTSGVRGRKLRSIMIGGRRYVLKEDLDLFLEEGLADKASPSTSYPSPAISVEPIDHAGLELSRRFDI